ncbi:hypothetical protein [Brachybacterium sacelli]|uniref:Stage II sporulation protein M n=2 Tax=Brachybacterium sacelli TaxID=173364 RepID=A0ABS4WVW7_9MICO|nr:hypothetical protein [Brachybacterium sacelli]MBP2380344.1 hypothetical protein [Brachybacterium sacelli]
MRVLRTPLQIIRADLRAYLALTAMAYGLLLLGMALGLLFPDLNAALTGSMGASGETDLVVSLLAQPWLFAATIFAVNIARIALASILLPSLIVPFLGIAVFAYFAVETGITLAPVNHAAAMTLIPHSLTIVIEYQAYVLLLLGAFLLGRSWLRPATVEAPTHRRGYVRGLQLIGRLALPALALFVVGAVYEAFSLRYLTPLLVVG